MSTRMTIFGAVLIFSTLVAWPASTTAQQSLQGKNENLPAVPTSSETVGDNRPSNVQVIPPFTVGSGDVLTISVWKEKDLSPTVTVRPDGKITMPLVGELLVAGLTPVQIEELLQHRLETLLLQPKVTVTVTEIHSLMVYITGEVSRPGAYPLNTPLTVLQLIAQAGGLTEFASRKNIRLIHVKGPQQTTICDYKKMIHAEDTSENPQLTPGDTVIVP